MNVFRVMFRPERSEGSDKRSAKGRVRRGASPYVSKSEGQGLVNTLSGLANRLPWRALMLNGALFCFWLAVLGGGATLLTMADRPITRIEVSGDARYLPQQRLSQRLAPYQSSSFFGADLRALRESLMQEAWVEDARVFRVWPNSIGVEIREKVPAFLWQGRGVVTRSGELFWPEAHWEAPALPRLTGAEGQHAVVHEAYTRWQPRFEALDLELTEVSRSDRGAWTLTVDTRWQIELGRQDTEERLNTFLDHYAQVLAEQKSQIARVDMRYSRGMAVRWRDEPVTEVPEKHNTGS